MAFCDAALWEQLYPAIKTTLTTEGVALGPENERKAASSVIESDGLGETWKSVPLCAAWSFWKDLTKPHNKVRYIYRSHTPGQ